MLEQKISEVKRLMANVSANESISRTNLDKIKLNNKFFSLYNCLEEIMFSIVETKKIGFYISDDANKYLQDAMIYAKGILESQTVKSIERFNVLIKKLQEITSKEWTGFIKSYTCDQINSLQIMRLVSKDKVTINRIIRELNSFNTWPVSDVDNIINQRNRANQSLKNYHFDAEIQEFLIKLQNKEANLTDLNSHIMNWLKSKDLEEEIILGIKA